MKKLKILLMVMLMSTASMSIYAKGGSDDMIKYVPTNIVVKQTIKFNDGRTLTFFYKKHGNLCEVYSPDDVSRYGMSDASKVKSTTFDVVERAEGRMYRKVMMGEVKRIIKRTIGQFLL